MIQRRFEKKITIGMAGLPEDASRELGRASDQVGAAALAFAAPRQLHNHVRAWGLTALFMDLEWAERGGLQIIARLSAVPASPLKLVCSRKSRVQSCIELLRSGFDDFVIYPVTEAKAGVVMERVAALAVCGVGGGGLRSATTGAPEPLAVLFRSGLQEWMGSLSDRKLSSGVPGGWGKLLSEMMEREMIAAVMDRFHQNRSQAAAFLGIHRNTLARKLRELKLEKRRLGPLSGK